MSNKNLFSDKFNKVTKIAKVTLISVGATAVAAITLPIVAISAPVVAIGCLIYIGYNKGR